jgi:hypothetical protein
MRAIKAFAVIIAVVVGGLGWTVPAHAAGETITGQDTDYAPHIDGGGPTILFARFTYRNVASTIHVVTTVGDQPIAMTPSGCVRAGFGKFVCAPAPGGEGVISFAIAPGALMNATQVIGASALTAVATIENSTVTATSHIYVKPQADLAITGLAVRNYGGADGAKLEFNFTDAGPSGSLRTTIVVTGYHSRPTQSLEASCAWSGALTITCTFHGGITERAGESLSLPLVTAQAVCAYRVAVSGAYADPKTSNNVATITDHGESCPGSTTVAASSTPKSPAASASPRAVKPSASPVPSTSASPVAFASTPPTLTLTSVATGGHRIMVAAAIGVLAMLAVGGLLVLRSRRS